MSILKIIRSDALIGSGTISIPGSLSTMRDGMRRIFPVFLFCLLFGCDSVRQKAEELASPSQRGPSVQRFIPFPEIGGNIIGSWWLFGLPRAYFALDTESGLMCRTWDFSFDNPNKAQQTAMTIPTCNSLYTLSQTVKPPVPK